MLIEPNPSCAISMNRRTTSEMVGNYLQCLFSAARISLFYLEVIFLPIYKYYFLSILGSRNKLLHKIYEKMWCHNSGLQISHLNHSYRLHIISLRNFYAPNNDPKRYDTFSFICCPKSGKVLIDTEIGPGGAAKTH